jgi:ABC-type transport system involved in multi-copper enzyme maturation permease subunit
MKTLLWKDYRHNRNLLGMAVAFLAVPYVVIALAVMYSLLNSEAYPENWADLIGGASIASLFPAAILGAFIAGNAIAGERGDRTAEFAAYLPIARRHALLSKAILAIGSTASFWLVNLIVFLVLSPWRQTLIARDLHEFALLPPAAIMLFGVSWLYSSLLNRPTIATLAGLGTTATAIVAPIIALKSSGVLERTIIDLYLGSCPALGILCFIIGAAYYLRRVEP